MKKIYMQPECEWVKLQDDIVRTSETEYGYDDGEGTFNQDTKVDKWDW